MSWNAEWFKDLVTDNAYNEVLAICVEGTAKAKMNMNRLAGNASSEPGDWPARQTSSMADQVTYQVDRTVDGVVGFVGILPQIEGGQPLGEGELGYPYLLEVGTAKMLPRPWMTYLMDHLERTFGITFDRDIGGAIARGVVRGLFE